MPPERLQKLSVRQRIAGLVRARLEALGQHREAIRRAGIASTLPTNLMDSGRALWRTVDRMWEAAGIPGDRRDFSYYTRRATLTGVLVSTFLFWLEDQSEGFADTWAFLDRRIEDAMRIGRVRSRFDEIFGRGRGAASHA
jgi:ubiquinone biosynthesis protein COQ9